VLSDDNNSGILTFLVGLILVVMVAVGLSVLLESRFSFSRNTRELESVIASNKEELSRLEIRIEDARSQLTSSEPKLRSAESELKATRPLLQENQAKLVELTRRRDEAQRSIPVLEKEFQTYRKRYREQTWAEAVGQSLGDLEIRGGKIYQNATITKVTEVGLEIRHSDGIARVQGPDLPEALRDRFQWNDEERMKRLQEEIANHEALSKPAPDTAVKPKPAPAKPKWSTRNPVAAAKSTGTDPAKIEAARKKVIGWKSRVSQLSSDRATAQSKASNSQTSVPGSLETWQARASRLTGELSRAKGELAAAKAELELVNPGDPLLRPVPGSSE
jgi:chromosome segregation ATPase